MREVKKGDIVGRLSYGKDIAFVVERIIKTKDNKKIAILKGLTIRVQADSDIEDLELMEPEQIEQHVRALEETVAKRIQKYANTNIDSKKEKYLFREKTIIYTGKILHIDGDKGYLDRCMQFYKNMNIASYGVVSSEDKIQDNIIYICTDTGNMYFGKNQLCTTPTTVTVEDVVYNKENNSITIDYTGNKESTIIQLTTPTAVLGTF